MVMVIDMLRFYGVTVLALALAGCAGLAPPAGCIGPAFAPIPVTVENDTIFLPATLNGAEVTAVFDTGSTITYISPAAARRAGVQVRGNAWDSRGFAGSMPSSFGGALNIQLGTAEAQQGAAVIAAFDGSQNGKVGLQLGRDILALYDWDLDFPHGTLTPYPVGGCRQAAPAWRSNAVELNPEHVPPGHASGPLAVPVHFIHNDFLAVIDSDSTAAVLPESLARKLGITAADMRKDQVEKVTGLNGQPVRLHFHEIPPFVVGPQVIEGMSGIIMPDSINPLPGYMILGANWITRNHIWLSLSKPSVMLENTQ